MTILERLISEQHPPPQVEIKKTKEVRTFPQEQLPVNKPLTHPSAQNSLVPPKKKEEQRVWMENVASAVREYCDRTGFKFFNIADELGIQRLDIQHLTKADGYVMRDKGLVYAKLYQLGIKEADPRTIPPMYKFIPKPTPGHIKELPRAWTNEELSAFLGSTGPKEPLGSIPSSQEHTAPAEQESDVVEEEPKQSLTALITLPEELIERITMEVEKRAVDRISTLFAHLESPGTSKDLGEMARELKKRLQPYMEGTSSDRDDLYKKYGRDLAKLLPLIDHLTKEKTARERSIKTQEKFNRFHG